MKRIATLSLFVCLFAAAALAGDGAWTASLDEKRPDRLHMNMTRGRMNHMGTTMPVATFTGLTTAQIRAAGAAPVRFELRREAGDAVFEGSFRNGKGAGHFTFTPNPRYFDAVRALGVETASRKGRASRDRDEESHLFALALHDVSTAFIRSMIAEGYRVSLDDYLSMRIFDVTPEYIREMRSLGFKDISADDLVATRIHKVTPAYVRQMRAAGWDLSLDELQSSRIHGATPEFAEEMRKAGYAGLSHDDLVSFRIHRVEPNMLGKMGK